MITLDELNRLATHFQVPEINVAREYCQHLFLSQLYKLDDTENILFKGGTALRIIYGSPRFSEDLDFSSFNIPPHSLAGFAENSFLTTLSFIESMGIKVEFNSKTGETSGGYLGRAVFTLHNLQVEIEIQISKRNGRKVRGEVAAIPNEFVPDYNLYHLPLNLLVGEKIKALFEREKARDFYDLYIMLRKGLVNVEHKAQLIEAADRVAKSSIDVEGELKTLLPQSYHPIIRDLKSNLLKELGHQLSAETFRRG